MKNPIHNLRAAAAHTMKNLNIFNLSDEDMVAALVEKMGAKEFYPQFNHFFGDFSDEFAVETNAKSPSLKLKRDYDNTKASFSAFIESLKPGQEGYDDMLDSIIDAYLETKYLEFDQRPEAHKLGTFLDHKKTNDEVWLEVGAGLTGIALVDEFRKHPDAHKLRYILNDYSKPDVVHVIQRYADRLGLTNVATFHADAGSEDFRKQLKKLVGDNKISQIRASQVVEYIKNKDMFFKNCRDLLKTDGKLHIKEAHVPLGEIPSQKNRDILDKKGWEISTIPGGEKIALKYDPKDFAKRHGFGHTEHFKERGSLLQHYITLRKL